MRAHESPRSRVRRENYAARRSETTGKWRRPPTNFTSICTCPALLACFLPELVASKRNDGRKFQLQDFPSAARICSVI